MAKLDVIEGGNGMPPEPDWSQIFNDELDQALAHDTWATVIAELNGSEKLATANAHMVKRYAVAAVQFEQALRAVEETGPVTKSKKGNQVYNLWWTVQKQAESTLTELEAELTISPRRRNNGGKVTRKAKSAAAADSYLKPVKKA